MYLRVWSLFALALIAVAVDLQEVEDRSLASRCLYLCECRRVPRARQANIVVTCHNLPGFPKAVPLHTTDLDLQGSRLGHIGDLSLPPEGLERLQTLDLSHAQVTQVDEDAFLRLQNLRIIDLSDNSITELTPKHFAGLRRLVLVDLTGNPGLECEALRRELAPRIRVLCDNEGRERTTPPKYRETSTMPMESTESTESTKLETTEDEFVYEDKDTTTMAFDDVVTTLDLGTTTNEFGDEIEEEVVSYDGTGVMGVWIASVVVVSVVGLVVTWVCFVYSRRRYGNWMQLLVRD